MATAAAPARRGLIEDFPRLLAQRGAGPGSIERLEALRERMRRFSDEWIAPRALELDARAELDPGDFDWDLVRRGAEHGLLSLMVPEPAGGQGALAVDTAIAMEELCAGCPGIALIDRKSVV